MQSTEPENWLPVVGYEGFYEVSNLGRLRSLDRSDARGYFRSGRVMEPIIRPTGHRRATLSRDGAKENVYLHRIVLAAFSGPCPDGMEGCHSDGDPSNNAASNLRWDTRAANVHDREVHANRNRSGVRYCNRGHVLEAPNLIPPRVCRTCSAARQYARRRGMAYDEAHAATTYSRVMGTTP